MCYNEDMSIYEIQNTILDTFYGLSEFPFVFSGGTALSRYYLQHRESEDLDFFCKDITLDFEYIYRIINQNLRFKGFICEETERADKTGQIKYIIFVVTSPTGISIKVDFLEDPFAGMWEPQTRKDYTANPVQVDALELIYYRKLYSVTYGRHSLAERVKDIIDLYFLDKVKPVLTMIEYTIKHNIGMDWLRFFQRLEEPHEISLERVKLLKPLNADTLSKWLTDISKKGVTKLIGGKI
jgi:predicted nucleotidyltransferase component of viral defense system